MLCMWEKKRERGKERERKIFEGGYKSQQSLDEEKKERNFCAPSLKNVSLEFKRYYTTAGC
jgi:hypothetical protein